MQLPIEEFFNLFGKDGSKHPLAEALRTQPTLSHRA
jgi:hypothetical protein